MESLNQLLRDMLVATGLVTKEASKLYSIHSFRRYLSCALLAAGCSEPRAEEQRSLSESPHPSPSIPSACKFHTV